MLFKSNLISKRNELLNNVDESGPKVDQNLNSFNENQSYSNKSIHAKLNALEKQIADLNGEWVLKMNQQVYIIEELSLDETLLVKHFMIARKSLTKKEMQFTEIFLHI